MTMILRMVWICLSLLLLNGVTVFAQQAAGPIDLAVAAKYFAEAKSIFDEDAERLWGVSLNGPMMFVDPRTRVMVTNTADLNGVLRATDGVFVGQLPNHVMIANTSTQWAGQKWTMLMWPLPRDKDRRGVLLAHEAWHRIQDDIGFKASGAANNHLNSLQGRYLLQLEWRALARALRSSGDRRGESVLDALAFRALRHMEFATETEEASMELHEGLAEYTGIHLGISRGGRNVWTAELLERRPRQMKTFVRSFAYLSGPAYGMLLDDVDPEWVASLKPTDNLADRLAAAIDIELPSDIESFVRQRRDLYDGTALLELETARQKETKRIATAHVTKFINGPRLEFPVHKISMSFDPNTSIPLDGEGTVYPTLTVSDRWGVLEITDGAMISDDFKKIVVSVPGGYKAHLKTDGWNLELADGWVIKKSESCWTVIAVKK